MKIEFTAAALLLTLLTSCWKDDQRCNTTIDKNFNITGFNKIVAGENLSITITKGNNYQVKAKGCSNDIADLRVDITPGNTLEIGYSRYQKKRSRLDIEISLPQLVSLNLGGASKGTITGFEGQNSVIRNVLSGSSQCTMTGTAFNAQVDLSGSSVLNLSGSTENLYGIISGNARLNSYEVTATEVDISTSGTGKAYVKPVQSFFAEASGESRIYYRGNPPVTHFNTSGNGHIIRE